MGMRRKKSLHARERDTEANLRRREEFLRQIGAIELKRLIFLDESGVTTQMTRLYARCQGGGRIHEGAPEGHWKVLTTLGAMSLEGMVATMTVEAATDGDVFEAFLEQVLCQKLKAGDVVVMDNLSVHKIDRVRELIEGAHARLLYLPPYSPDVNPIEKAWSKFKQFLRSAKARTAEALDQAVTAALETITAENAKAWFRHCGYGIQQV
jgi:transposase